MDKRNSRPLLLLAAAALAASCATAPPGLNGPDRQSADPDPGGPCFEADISDGIADGAELLTIFECFNLYGAFDEVEPVVTYLATSEDAEAAVTAANESMGTFDVVAGLETAARMLTAEDAPLSQALGLFTAAVDLDLVTPGMGAAREAAEVMATCEASADPTSCSLPRMARNLLDTDIPDQAGRVLDAVSGALTEEEADASLQGTLQLLYETSSVSSVGTDHPTNRNLILELGAFFLDESVEGGAPVEQLLPTIQELMANEDLPDALALHMGRLWRDEKIQRLPDDLTYIFTHNSAGDEVGYDGTNLMDELLDATSTLGTDTSMLSEELDLEDGGATGTNIALVLQKLDSLYVSRASPEELIAELEFAQKQVCDIDRLEDYCLLLTDVVAIMSTILRNTDGVTDTLLATAYVIHEEVDVEGLLPLMDLVLTWDLAGRTRDLSAISVELGTIDSIIPLFPVFIDPELGKMTPAGRDAVALARFMVSPWDPEGDGTEIVPLVVPLDLARAALDPRYPNANLDPLLGTVARELRDSDSPLYLDRLTAIGESLSDALGEQDVDLVETAKELLDNEALWTAGIDLMADPALIDLLAPVEGREGATWYLYDLIDRGVVDRALSLLANLMQTLIDKGIIDDPAAER